MVFYFKIYVYHLTSENIEIVAYFNIVLKLLGKLAWKMEEIASCVYVIFKISLLNY